MTKHFKVHKLEKCGGFDVCVDKRCELDPGRVAKLTDPCPFLEFLLDILSSCSEYTPFRSLYGFEDLE
jgi:hypothetical protein